ncbi:hypothetical protein BGZ65_005246 [Modicella reniformis]|uniref:Uncharacterized protein n=1 Tax=Modicella reniformis TaxID=1440133 RepID=A0A9P6IXL4_9FUNG|nr:hypothetical protein BGZ65_005246 [Modicella reniformis]
MAPRPKKMFKFSASQSLMGSSLFGGALGDFASGVPIAAVISVKEDPIIDKDVPDRYAFDLVLSTSNELPAAFVTTAIVVPEDPENKRNSSGKSFKEMFPDMYQDTLKLLKDPRSVNVAFVFTVHSCHREIGLWAHRTHLDKYPGFAIFWIVISLSTFCVLLKYIYTKDLDLAVDPTQYLICDMKDIQHETSKDPASSLVELNKSLDECSATKLYEMWDIEDKVTWTDLFLAADRFKIVELCEQCLEDVLASVEKDNALELLFRVGSRFKEQIRDPIMKTSSPYRLRTHSRVLLTAKDILK